MSEEVDNIDVSDTDVLVLTTIDNPYNPKTNYDDWKQWDEDNGYYTEAYVGRLIVMEEEEFDVDDVFVLNDLIEKVYQDVLENDVLGVYMLI